MSEKSPQTQAPAATPDSSTVGSKVRNLLVVSVAVVLALAIFLGMRVQSPTASLSTLAAEATPLEEALANPQPTLMEFYANWCTSCQAMAADMARLRSDYKDRVNFVMLNVDNMKWLPEMLEYRVDGIPHFVYLDRQGEAVSDAIGEMPRPIIAENLDALIAQQPLPHQQAFGRTSAVEPQLQGSVNDDPRSHGAQVQSSVQ